MCNSSLVCAETVAGRQVGRQRIAWGALLPSQKSRPYYLYLIHFSYICGKKKPAHDLSRIRASKNHVNFFVGNLEQVWGIALDKHDDLVGLCSCFLLLLCLFPFGERHRNIYVFYTYSLILVLPPSFFIFHYSSYLLPHFAPFRSSSFSFSRSQSTSFLPHIP